MLETTHDKLWNLTSKYNKLKTMLLVKKIHFHMILSIPQLSSPKIPPAFDDTLEGTHLHPRSWAWPCLHATVWLGAKLPDPLMILSILRQCIGFLPAWPLHDHLSCINVHFLVFRSYSEKHCNRTRTSLSIAWTNNLMYCHTYVITQHLS